MKWLKLFKLSLYLFLVLHYSNGYTTTELTHAQLQWIKQHPTIKTAGGLDWSPFDFVEKKPNNTLQYKGISHDILELISQKTGLIFDVEIDQWNNNLTKIKNGEIDLLPILNKSSQREEFLIFTQPYYDVFNYFFIRDDIKTTPIDDLTTLRVAIPKDFSYAKQLNQFYPNLEIISTNTLTEAIFAVLENKADMLYDSYTALSYTLNKLSVNNIVPLMSSKRMPLNRLYMATSKDNHMLISILNAALTDISPTIKNKIFIKWQKKKTNPLLLWTLALLTLISLLLILRAWVLSTEIKKRKKVQQELRQERKTFRRLIENSPDGIMIAINKQLVDCNKTAISMLGFTSKQEVINSKITDLIQVTQPDGSNSITLIKNMIRKCIDEGYARYKLKAHSKNKADFWIDVIQIPIKYLGENAIYILWRDITNHVKLTQQLVDAQKQANKANKAKSQFLANMSHEIRTPMNAIIGFTDVLAERINDEKTNKIIYTIKQAGNNLLSLINDILDLSKIEAGKFEIQTKAVNLHDLFNEICQLFSVSINKKDLAFEIDIDSTIPTSLILDPKCLRQVLLNLLGNALKFTDKGTIKLSAKIIAVDDHHSKVDLLIEISDTGIGIAQDQLNTIFNPFEQQEGQDHNLYKGTGLGLAISQKLINKMNGSISVKSIINKGSTFSVRLNSIDIAAIDTSEIKLVKQKTTQQIIFKKARILIVDDINYNRFLITEIFSQSGLEFVEAENGLEAIQAVKSNNIDLILMDIRMPKMDGYTATEHIKKSDPKLPIIALTASTLDSNDASTSALFDAYIRKPIEKNQLIKLIAQYLPHKVNAAKTATKAQIDYEENLSQQQIEKLLNDIHMQCHYLWEKATDSNHLSDISEFAQCLKRRNQEYNSNKLETYIRTLNNSIELFDIAEINLQLKAFEQLKKTL